ncbi:hypothetical protein SAMN05216327_12417 [Dyadobacter sp. SG02]|uniref:hypothetical protein n=1 Tax=Dyadobacter sp. SG02 TaxID=1855291 RepID=UPI0008BC3BE5|nr:hypothetical protein [Dyadobacter sp. SG02]SEJ84416.1 hypothetical protein SAMN05216327_12417 [Dyadobacter sp. SG02]
MKLKWLPVLIASLFAVKGFGQSKSVSIPVYKSGDTTLHYKWQRERIARMKMIDPLASNYAFLLRISCENWSVEIKSINFKTISGRQYFFTREVAAQSGNSDRDLLFKVKRISRADALAIYQAFKKDSIKSIPDEQAIRGWPLGADGMSYLIEYKTYSAYTFKTYWEPSSSRHRLKEAAAIDDFVKAIEARLGLGKSFLAFLNTLPPGTYHTGGITVHTNTGKKGKIRK